MVRVGTWNVENLFRPRGPAGSETEVAYSAKLDALAATITELAPDVLAVQEIGEPEALDDLVARVGGAWQVELADPDGRGNTPTSGTTGQAANSPLTNIGASTGLLRQYFPKGTELSRWSAEDRRRRQRAQQPAPHNP